MTPKHPVDLLLVEDSLSDIELITEILEESNTQLNLHIVRDGEEAMLFLHQQGQYKGGIRPDLVLLDLNLPKKNGYEVLAEIKTHSVLRQIPVIVFTTSALQEDVLRAYDLHANAYMVKSKNFQDLLQSIHAVEDYWLSSVQLPSNL